MSPLKKHEPRQRVVSVLHYEYRSELEIRKSPIEIQIYTKKQVAQQSSNNVGKRSLALGKGFAFSFRSYR